MLSLPVFAISVSGLREPVGTRVLTHFSAQPSAVSPGEQFPGPHFEHGSVFSRKSGSSRCRQVSPVRVLAHLIPRTRAGEAGPMAGWHLERVLAQGPGPAFADAGALGQSC